MKLFDFGGHVGFEGRFERVVELRVERDVERVGAPQESSGVTLRLTERKIPSLLRSVWVRFWASTVKSCPLRSVRALDGSWGGFSSAAGR